MPLLRHADLAVSIPGTFSLHKVPLLRTAVLDNIAASTVTLPWGQLTSLTLRCVCPPRCVPILLQTSNLVHCQLGLVYDIDAEYNSNIPDVQLPRLESLVLTDFLSHYAPAVTGYLETLIAPALLSLHIPGQFLGPNPIDSRIIGI